jgi:hypothetical protein
MEDKFRPTNYSLGEKATFDNTQAGIWIVSESAQDRPLEVINKKDNQINFWDWEPRKLVNNFLLTSEEFDTGDYRHIVVGGSDVSIGQKDVDPE